MFVLLSWAAFASAGDPLVLIGSDTGHFTPVQSDECAGTQTSDTGSGHATHLGSYIFEASECIEPLPDGTFKITDGEIKLKAANGDIITATYSGSADEELRYAVSGFITGGTGRFAGATGTFTLLGGGDFAAGAFYDTMVMNVYGTK
jgi:hypothetical protein